MSTRLIGLSVDYKLGNVVTICIQDAELYILGSLEFTESVAAALLSHKYPHSEVAYDNANALLIHFSLTKLCCRTYMYANLLRIIGVSVSHCRFTVRINCT